MPKEPIRPSSRPINDPATGSPWQEVALFCIGQLKQLTAASARIGGSAAATRGLRRRKRQREVAQSPGTARASLLGFELLNA